MIGTSLFCIIADLIFIIILMSTMANLSGKYYWIINLLYLFWLLALMVFLCYLKAKPNSSLLIKFSPILTMAQFILSVMITLEVFGIGLDNLWATSAFGKFIMLAFNVTFDAFWYQAYKFFDEYSED